jgi:hypothetical protein
VTLSWAALLGTATVATTSGPLGTSLTFTPADGPNTYVVRLTASDGLASASTTSTVVVNNVAPIINPIVPPANAGSIVNVSATDAAADIVTVTVSATGPGGFSTVVTGSSAGAATVGFVPPTAGTYNVSVTAADDDGAVTTTATAFTLAAPVYTIEDGSNPSNIYSMIRTITVTGLSGTGSTVEVASLTGPAGIIFARGANVTGPLPAPTGAANEVVVNASRTGSTAVLTFSGTPVVGGSLPNGTYTLNVTGAGPVTFQRKFGDSNGDGFVDTIDLFGIYSTFGKRFGDPGYIADFDFDNSGNIDTLDLFRFYAVFGT